MISTRSIFRRVLSLALLLSLQIHQRPVEAFSGTSTGLQQRMQSQCQTQLPMSTDPSDGSRDLSRRSFVQSGLVSAGLMFALDPTIALAAERPPLKTLLYRILRVREATQQEVRLIKNGTFKDIQRANIKLAVKFMIENYRLADAFVAASAYLDGNDRRVAAGQVGQSAVQNLYTILEYFDSSDVQNLKVGQSGAMAGKEELVIKGLDATRRTIDDFLAYFPKAELDAVAAMVEEENELNRKEFDANSLGPLLNMPKK